MRGLYSFSVHSVSFHKVYTLLDEIKQGKCLFFHKMAYTLLDGDNATTVSEFQIDTLVYRDAITIVSVTFPLSRTSPNGANPIYQLRVLSIVCLNKQLWRSAISVYFVIRSTVFHLTSISESCIAK